MKPSIAIPLGIGGILAAIGTTIANANGLFAGHPSLAYWFWGASAISITVSTVGGFLGRVKARHIIPPPAPPASAPPNLMLLGFEMTPIEQREGVWSRAPNSKMAWVAFIHNAPLEDRDVGTVSVRAEILYYPEKGRCHKVSPATWLDQIDNTVRLKSGDTKDLVIAVETHPRWNWGLLANGSPCNYGDLWATRPNFEFEIRLIDDATGKLMRPSYCFKWEWSGDSRPSIRLIEKITLE